MRRTAARRRAPAVDTRLLLLIVFGALAVVLLIVGIAGMTRGDKVAATSVDTSRHINWNATAAPVADSTENTYFVQDGADSAAAQPQQDVPSEPEALPQAESEPAEAFETAAQPVASAPISARDDEYAANAIYRPEAKEGFLPVFAQSGTQEKVIAITIDDCYQGENIMTIVDATIAAGAKVTFFPIGKNVTRTPHRDALKKAWENGFELENHTMTHNNLIRSTPEELAWEVYQQQLELSEILGVEYHVHFLRGRGGDSRNDQRIHAYIGQIGYYGVAHWSKSGSANTIDNLKQTIEPGLIYLFHTTDSDTKKLVEFIPWAVSQGYQLVTLNEMFGYPDNEYSELTQPLEAYKIPPLEPYRLADVTYKKTTYAHGAYVIQEQLIALGYLSGDPDGVYGGGTEKAVAAFQRDHALEVTGKADPATQAALLQAYMAAGYPDNDTYAIRS